VQLPPQQWQCNCRPNNGSATAAPTMVSLEIGKLSHSRSQAGKPSMETIWIEEKQLARSLGRNEAFWEGELEECALMWVTAPKAGPGQPPGEPDREEEIWTDVDYVIASAEYQLAGTYYAGDALPVYNPWLGPDQVAGWLGAEMTLKPRQFTSDGGSFTWRSSVDRWKRAEVNGLPRIPICTPGSMH